jgi:hypothetical protein
MDIETGLHFRILVNWYAFIKTFQGSIYRKDKRYKRRRCVYIVPHGVRTTTTLHHCSQTPGAKSIPVIAKLAWSDKLDIGDKAVLGMGIRFMAISPEDRQYIAAVVEQNRSVQPY